MLEFSDKTLEIFSNKLVMWLDQVILLIPNGILAILVLVCFIFISKFVNRATNLSFLKLTHNPIISRLFAISARMAVIIIGIFLALEILQLGKIVTSLLAGAGIVGLAIGIAFQDSVSNIIAGVYIALKKTLKLDDIIATGDKFGTVKQMSLRSTTILSMTGQMIHIPNKDIFQTALTNYSQFKKRRIDIPVGVQYGADLEKVKKIVLDVLENIPTRLPTEPTDVFFTDFGASSINFVAQFWIHYKKETDNYVAIDQAIIGIKKAFNKEGIIIPFPIRTLDIDGAQLNSVLRSK